MNCLKAESQCSGVTLFLVIGVIVLVMFGVIPQLGETFTRLGESIQAFIPQIQQWTAMIFHDNKEITMIMMKTEQCFFGLFKNTEVYMPEGFEVRQGESEYYIHNTKKDNIKITTFSQGEKQLKKLLKDYKRCLDELKIKELQADF